MSSYFDKIAAGDEPEEEMTPEEYMDQDYEYDPEDEMTEQELEDYYSELENIGDEETEELPEGD